MNVIGFTHRKALVPSASTSRNKNMQSQVKYKYFIAMFGANYEPPYMI